MIVQTTTPPTYQFVQYIEVQQMITAAVEPLKNKILQLDSARLAEWVDTKEAMRLTGIKQAETLKAERERPHTKLVVKFEGKKRKMPRYLVSSLLAYNEARMERRHLGRNLAE
jgi:hypothetical protein